MKKILAVILSILVVFLIIFLAGYNFFTSEYGIKNFVFPYIAEKMNTDISAENIKVSGLKSYINIKNLDYSSDKFKIKAGTLEIKTSLFDFIFAHKINLKSLLFRNSYIFANITPGDNNISNKEKARIQEENENSALTPVTKNSPYKITLSNIDIQNLNVTVKNNLTETKISELNLNIPLLMPDKECNIKLNGKLSMVNNKSILSGLIKSETQTKLNENFLPVYIDSNSLVELGKNKMPVCIKLETEKQKNFYFKANIDSIFITPFTEAFIPGLYGSTKGMIQNLNISMTGTNINDIVSGGNKVNTEVEINGVDVNNEGIFTIKNKSIAVQFDLSAIRKGDYIPGKFTVDTLVAKYIDKEQKIDISDFNINLVNGQGTDNIKTDLNGAFIYAKKDGNLAGLISGNINFSSNMLSGKPEIGYADINLKVKENNIPIKISYYNSLNNEKISIDVRDVDFEPFLDFALPNSKLLGSLNCISITVNGNCANALSKIKDSNVLLSTDINMTGFEFQDPEKYSLALKDFSTSMNLNNILNNKFYLNKLHIKTPHVLSIKTAEKIKTKNNGNEINQRKDIGENNKNILQGTETEVRKKNNFDLDIKDISITGGNIEIAANRKLVFSNFSIGSSEVRTDKLSDIKIGTDYDIDGKMNGSIYSDNKILLTENLMLGKLSSIIEVRNGTDSSKSTVDFTSAENDNDTIAFNSKVNINKLLIDPFITAFVSQPYNTSRANLDSLEINMDGNNIKEPLKADGSIKGKLTDISVPVNVKDENIIEALFFPLRVIAELASNTGFKFVSGNVADAMIKIDNTFNRRKIIDFSKADINVGLNSGNIIISNLDFTGDEKSPVSEIKISGNMNLNNNALNLSTNTVFAGLNIPVEVTGTIKKPKTDNTKIAALLIQNNADTLVKTSLEMKDTINNTVKNIKEKKFDQILQSIPANSNQNQNTVDQLLNAVKAQEKAVKNDNQKSKETNNEPVNQILNILQNTVKKNNGNSEKKQDSNSDAINLNNQIKNLLNF